MVAVGAERPENPMAEFLLRVHERRLIEALSVPPLLRGPNHEEPE